MRRSILVVRHCQASGQEAGAPLTEDGVRQAGELAGFLDDVERLGAEVDRIVSSPFERARRSIAPFAARRGLEVEVDVGLAEREISPEPTPHWREILRDSFDDPDLRAPGGESARQVLERARAVLVRLVSAGHRLPLVVSHGNWISLVLHSIEGRFGYAGWESLSNPDVHRIEWSDGAPRSFERLWPPRGRAS